MSNIATPLAFVGFFICFFACIWLGALLRKERRAHVETQETLAVVLRADELKEKELDDLSAMREIIEISNPDLLHWIIADVTVRACMLEQERKDATYPRMLLDKLFAFARSRGIEPLSEDEYLAERYSHDVFVATREPFADLGAGICVPGFTGDERVLA